MSSRAHWLFVLAACAGCRQLFGIEDTQVGDDLVDVDAPTDGAGNGGPDGAFDGRPPDGAPDATPPDASACVALYPMLFNGHRYMLGNNNQTWDSAQAACAATGAYLAIPDDPAENDYIRNLNAGQVWIGVTDRVQEGIWVTLKGETVPPHYENWGAGLPNGGTSENCAMVPTSAGGADGEWDDSDCPNSRRPLCECEP